MKLSNHNLTATNMSHGDFEAVYGNIAISSDTHYWEVKINYIRDMNDVMIGVMQGQPRVSDSRMRYSVYDRFYAWHATAGRKMRPNPSGNGRPEQSDYGQHAKQGDTIGCILEFKNGLGQITFVKNGATQGVAFKDLPADNYYPQCLLYCDGVQVTLNPHASLDKAFY